MLYEDALKLWGESKLREQHNLLESFRVENVRIKIEFYEGDSCCGESCPSCHPDIPPRSDVVIAGDVLGPRGDTQVVTHIIPVTEFDIRDALRDIILTGGGNLYVEE